MFGKFKRIFDSVRKVLKKFAHLLFCFKIELRVFGFQSLCIGFFLSGGYANENIVSAGVVFFQEMNVIGGDNGNAGFFGEAPHAGTYSFLFGYAVIHHLQIEIPRTEEPVVVFGFRPCFLPVSVKDGLRDFATQTSGRGNQALVVLFE